MKEKELREMVRKEILRNLSEAGPGLGTGGAQITRGLGKVKSSRVSHLTRAQRVSAVLPVLKKFAISASDLSLIKRALSGASDESPTDESVQEAGLSGALVSRGEKLEKTQAYKMLTKAIATKPATQQAEFVLDMINKLSLDDSAKKRLKMRIRQM